jgi:hypothetical protein
MERFNKAQILNQFVLLCGKNVIEKSSMIWRVLQLVKINTRISESPCILQIGKNQYSTRL